jgi:transposase
MGEMRRKFDQYFREGSFRRVRETGKPIAQIARDLGISRPTTAGPETRKDAIAKRQRT